MDIHDRLVDFALLLRRFLDYLGLDLFYIPLPDARYRALRTQTACKKRLTLIRKIADVCSFIKTNKIYIQPHLIGGAGCDDSFSSVSTNCPSLSDLHWIVDETQDGRYKAAKIRSDICRLQPGNRTAVLNHTKLHEGQMTLTRCSIFTNNDEFSCSTPDVTSNRSISNIVDNAAMEKITALEDELTKLRLLIAQVATVKETQPDVIPKLESNIPNPPPTLTTTMTLAAGAPHAPPMLPVVGGVPPPPCGAPPPPPPPPPLAMANAPKKSVQEIIAERRGKKVTDESNKPIPSMADVLKGLGSVKLKSVNRSPGGTPLDRRPLPANQSTDAASLIAAALKKKFQSAKLSSPQTPQTPDSPDVILTPPACKVLNNLRQQRLSFNSCRVETNETGNDPMIAELNKENRMMSNMSLSPLSSRKNNRSPEKSQFGQHLLRPSVRRTLTASNQ